MIDAATRYVEARGFASYDLFDALRSPVLDRITRPFPLGRRVAIQLLRRLPFNVRPALGIAPMVHTKTLSDMLSIYTEEVRRHGDPRVEAKANATYDLLLSRALRLGRALGWGLNFPYTTRFVDAGPKTPNLFNTVNAGVALLDYYDVVRAAGARATIADLLKFVTDELGVVRPTPESAWVRYYPGQEFPIVNVNASVAALLVRAEACLQETPTDGSLAAAILRSVADAQNPDGSWYYALTPNGQWIDGFHTGYVLEGLTVIHQLHPSLLQTASLERGVEYYVNHLFTAGGVPKYYHLHAGPLEAQNCAQAIQTLARLGIAGIRDTRALLTRAIDHTLRGLYDKRGFFYYRRGALLTNQQSYLRWSQTPMILALMTAEQYLRLK